MLRMKWKTLLLTSALSCLTTASFADAVTPPDLTTKPAADAPTPAPALNCPKPPRLKDGWYLGGQLGYESFHVHNNFASPATFTTTTAPTLAVNGWEGGLILGYGEMYNDWLYWAIEGFANATNLNQGFSLTDAASSYTNTFSTSSTLGLAFLPGVKFTPETLAYAKLGWSRAAVKTAETFTGITAATRSNDSSQFMFGVGFETLIMDNWSVRTEINHFSYSSYNTPMPYGTKVIPTDNQLNIGLIYHFWN